MSINLTTPKQWGDLTLDQFRKVVEVLLWTHLSEEVRLLIFFCYFTGCKMTSREVGEGTRFIAADGQAFTMQDYQVADFCGRLRWLMDTTPDRLPNPTKKDAYLRDISFGDWFEADIQFRLFEDDHDLAHFDHILPKLNMEVQPATEVEAMMLRLWWNTVMAQIAPMYPNVFTTTGGGGESNPFKSLQEMHLLLNNDQPQENEKIDNSRLHDVLSALDSAIEKMKRREAEYNKIRKR